MRCHPGRAAVLRRETRPAARAPTGWSDWYRPRVPTREENSMPVGHDRTALMELQTHGQDLPWLLSYWAERRPDHPLLVWDPPDGPVRTWTYRQMRDHVWRFAAGLTRRGIAKGDRVLIHAENSPEFVISWLGCAVAGAIAVTTNTRSVASEVRYFIEQAGCIAAITQPS